MSNVTGSTDPERAGREHRDLMVAHYQRLNNFCIDGMRWITQMEQAHHNYYRSVLGGLEQSNDPRDYDTWQTLDEQYVKQLAALQAASERLVEASAHIKRALVHPGDPVAHLKNVNWESK